MKALYLTPYLAGAIYIVLAFWARCNLRQGTSQKEKAKTSNVWWAFQPSIYNEKGRKIAFLGRLLIFYSLGICSLFMVELWK